MVGTLRSGRVSWEGGHHTPTHLVFVSCRTSDISESSQKPGFAEIFIHKGLQGTSTSTGLPHGYCAPGAGWPVPPTLPRIPTYGPHTQPHSRRKQGPSRPAPPIPASRKPGQHQRPSTRRKTPIPSGGGQGLKQHEAVVFSLEDSPPCPSRRDVNQRLEGPPSLTGELGQQAALCCCMRALARVGWGQALHPRGPGVRKGSPRPGGWSPRELLHPQPSQASDGALVSTESSALTFPPRGGVSCYSLIWGTVWQRLILSFSTVVKHT